MGGGCEHLLMVWAVAATGDGGVVGVVAFVVWAVVVGRHVC